MLSPRTRKTLNRLLAKVDLEVRPRHKPPRGADRGLAFFHVPKCGGTSILHALRDSFGVSNNGAETSSFVLDAPASRRSALALATPHDVQKALLLRYAFEQKGVRFIGGHFSYNESASADFAANWDFVTVLREPRDHLLSTYYFNRYKKSKGHFSTDLALEDWLESASAADTGRVFVRMFVGDTQTEQELEGRDVDPGLLQTSIDNAIQNLENFLIVGNLTRLDEFQKFINERYKTDINISRLNRSPVKAYPKFAEQDAAIKTKIEKLCEPNRVIFSHFFQHEQSAADVAA